MGTRAKPEPVKTTVGDLVSDAHSEIESLRDELQEWYDNMSENLQGGSKGDQLQEAIDGLNEFVDSYDEPDDDIGIIEVQFVPTPLKKLLNSRRKRRDEASAMLSTAISALEELEDNEEAEAYAEKLQEWMDAIDNVEFPGMYG